MKSKLLLVIFLVFIITLSLHSQENFITVETILNNPGYYVGTVVLTKGIVEQWVESPQGNYYILKGDYGGIITVNSETKPIVSKKYRVRGFVQTNPVTRNPYIVETWRELEEVESNWIYYALGGLGLLLIILLILYFTRKKHGASIIQEAPSSGQPLNESQQQFYGDLPLPETVKIEKADPVTMKFIPGKLEIISEVDRGSSFRIPGYPTANGNIVTIGKEEVRGDRKYAHIKIGEKFRTVSRRQAEIREKNGELFIKNLSKTNYTQVNGKELDVGESTELQFNDVIKMGELELKYIL